MLLTELNQLPNPNKSILSFHTVLQLFHLCTPIIPFCSVGRSKMIFWAVFFIFSSFSIMVMHQSWYISVWNNFGEEVQPKILIVTINISLWNLGEWMISVMLLIYFLTYPLIDPKNTKKMCAYCLIFDFSFIRTRWI